MKTLITLTLTTLLYQSGFPIDPLKEYKLRPERFGLEYLELKLKTIDDYEINTWIIEPIGDQHKNKTVVIAGSDTGNMGYMSYFAYHLAKSGYRVVTFDYRGFGDSTDFKFNPNNLYHSEYVTDFVTVMNWCKKEFESDKIGVLGFSMGTLITAIGYQDSKYDFYIGEGFLRSPTIVRNRILEHKGKEVNLPKTVTEDEKKVENLNVRMLLFASTTDQITTADDCHSFCESKKLAKTILYEGDHLRGAITMGMEKYFQEISIFIDSD